MDQIQITPILFYFEKAVQIKKVKVKETFCKGLSRK